MVEKILEVEQVNSKVDEEGPKFLENDEGEIVPEVSTISKNVHSEWNMLEKKQKIVKNAKVASSKEFNVEKSSHQRQSSNYEEEEEFEYSEENETQNSTPMAKLPTTCKVCI